MTIETTIQLGNIRMPTGAKALNPSTRALPGAQGPQNSTVLTWVETGRQVMVAIVCQLFLKASDF